LTIGYAVSQLGNCSLYIMECAWTSLAYSINNYYITISSPITVNPVASVGWGGSGTAPLFTVIMGSFSLKYEYLLNIVTNLDILYFSFLFFFFFFAGFLLFGLIVVAAMGSLP
jgi:hypothetical protein